MANPGLSLVKSTALNLAGYVIPMLFLFVATPIITTGLGSVRYGILSLVWLIIGYFVIFDLGLGSATTRFVAVAIGNDRTSEIPELIWTTALVQTAMGLLAGGILALLVPPLVERIFKIPSEFTSEAKRALWITSLTFPLTFVSGSLSGLFAAVQRFDLVNIVKVLNSISIYLAGILCVYLNQNIPFIIITVLIAKILVLILQFIIARHLVPTFFKSRPSLRILKRVAGFAGWITLSNLINPLMFYVDRFLIGATLSMSALTYYSVPFDLAARLWVISTSLTMALFPAFATLLAKGDGEKTCDYFVKSIKFLVMVSGPIVCLMLAFSRTILDLWLGAEFANQSTMVLQILLISTLFDYPGIIATTLLEGAGNPRVLAIAKMAYLPIHAIIAFSALRLFGLAGAAMAIFVMRLIYAVLFTEVAMRMLSMEKSYLLSRLFPAYFSITLFAIASILLDYWASPLNLLYLLMLGFGLVGLYSMMAWMLVLDVSERLFIRTTISALLERSILKKSATRN